MKIYNESKTEIIENPDLKKGWLNGDRIVSKVIPAVEAVEEKWHYDYVEYPSGGKDAIRVIDVPGVEAQPERYEYEDVLVFIPYTETELLENELRELDAWFEWYDIQIAQYERCKRRNKPFDKDVNALDEEADVKQVRHREIQNILQPVTNQLTNDNQSVIMEVEN